MCFRFVVGNKIMDQIYQQCIANDVNRTPLFIDDKVRHVGSTVIGKIVGWTSGERLLVIYPNSIAVDCAYGQYLIKVNLLDELAQIDTNNGNIVNMEMING